MKILCVAEKPSAAKEIAKILSQEQYRSRSTDEKYIRNMDFDYKLSNNQIVQMTMTSVLGHLLELDFASEYRSWRSCAPIALFDAPIVKSVNKNCVKVERNLCAEIRGVQQIMIWTDCDREGEGIGAEVVEVCRKVNPRITVLRARFSSFTHAEIHHAARNPIQLDMNQAQAVEARSELDLRIGAAFTRFQTLKFQTMFHELDKKVISYGSCQFPTLGFVVDRFQQIQSFVSEDFWRIDVTYAHPDPAEAGHVVQFNWARGRLFDRLFCFVLYEQCVEQPMARVFKVSGKDTSKWKPYPLTTVEMQKVGVRVLRMSSSKIMEVAERLYTRGLISYPRTETDQFDKGFDFRNMIEKQTGDQHWGQFAQGCHLVPSHLAFSMVLLACPAMGKTMTRRILQSIPLGMRTTCRMMNGMFSSLWCVGSLGLVQRMQRGSRRA
ncbi:hypothetical protein BC936DRAFT_136729 [Jimgerdemannia flammicorona]|uniref:DNA topoisomerase n=1 Tax=Jimgerdemannia flammicorona TaxID=994334 RepID=A0A433DJC1_9FUNG|nr:hypothetical protein BC936DRAFT_136729 [Jimgerdemannia flammicorona]